MTDATIEMQEPSMSSSQSTGRIVRTNDVLGGRWRIAGTRIPLKAILSLHQDGYSADAIVREYPGLTVEDVAAAIAWKPPTS